MKTRIISAVIGIPLLVIILFFYNSIILNIGISIVNAIMVYEIIQAIGILKKSVFAFAISEIYAISFPFLRFSDSMDLRIQTTIFYGMILVLILLKKHNIINVEKLVFFGFSCMTISFFMSTIIYIRDKFPPYSLYYIMLLFIIAWICDAGAYFIGIGFGRKKLAPNISPKKTVEGAIGGVFINFIFVGALTSIFTNIIYTEAKLNVIVLIVLTLIGSIFAIVGDLFASIVKRQYKIKDFGNLIPGHGGILDRFDSLIFVLAVSYPIICIFPIIR